MTRLMPARLLILILFATIVACQPGGPEEPPENSEENGNTLPDEGNEEDGGLGPLENEDDTISGPDEETDGVASPTPAPAATPTPIVIVEPTATATIEAVLPGAQGQTISGVAWDDANHNGLRDPDEMPLAGVAVVLYVFEVADTYDPASGAYDNFNGFSYPVAETFTDSAGFYQFTLDEAAIQLNYPHYVVFGQPPGYAFTIANADPADMLDSDVQAPGGETTSFSPQQAPLINLDAGYASLNEALAPTDTVTYTLSSDPGPIFVTFGDDAGDAINCGNNAAVDDAQVDMTGYVITLSDNWLTIQVNMAQPLSDDYSFAVSPYLFSIDQIAGVYLWEIHETVRRVGAMDPQTFQLLPDSDPPPQIQHDQAAGRLLFIMPLGALPEVMDYVYINAYHSPQAGAATRCDSAGPFLLPAPLWAGE